VSHAPVAGFVRHIVLPYILIPLALTGCVLQQNVASAPPSGKVGTKAPPLSGVTIEGEKLSVDFQDQKTVLVFWASWCGPCRHEQPDLNRMAADLAPRGIRFIGVDFLDHDRAAARAFVNEFRVPYPSLYDPSGKLAALYEVDAPPAKVLVDGRGVIVGRVPGEVPEQQLRRLIVEKLP